MEHRLTEQLYRGRLLQRLRLEEDRLACLVIVGVLPDGRKEVVALEDRYRESTESWASVLRDLKRRGLTAPMLAIGDGNLGFWAALREVHPETKEQRCWKHKLANVLDKLPKRLQARAKEMLHEIMYAPDRESALEEIAIFSDKYAARYPKAVETLTKDQDQLLTFLDFPAEHWVHLRTTNPIESTFSTVKARTKKTKGAGSRKAGLAMAFRLLKAAAQAIHRGFTVLEAAHGACHGEDVPFGVLGSRCRTGKAADGKDNLRLDLYDLLWVDLCQIGHPAGGALANSSTQPVSASGPYFPKLKDANPPTGSQEGTVRREGQIGDPIALLQLPHVIERVPHGPLGHLPEYELFPGPRRQQSTIGRESDGPGLLRHGQILVLSAVRYAP